jgi:hypothetical protein
MTREALHMATASVAIVTFWSLAIYVVTRNPRRSISGVFAGFSLAAANHHLTGLFLYPGPGDYASVTPFPLRWKWVTAVEPAEEMAHRALVLGYLARGRRDLARQQVARWRAVLDELHLGPAEEARALWRMVEEDTAGRRGRDIGAGFQYATSASSKQLS